MKRSMKRRSGRLRGVAPNRPRYSNFDLSHEKKLSMGFADLVPIYLQEIIPGDRFSGSSEILLRMAPMISPVMHRLKVYTHYFFVPHRLVWDNWEEFITAGEDGQAAHVFPNLQVTNSQKASFQKGKLSDYFGVPITDGKTLTQSFPISALPFRAYQLIYNEYYRDENLQEKVPFSRGNGNTQSDLGALTTMRQRNWEKDYFCSALPWAQKGDPVTVPIDIAYKSPAQNLDSLGDPAQAGQLDVDANGNIGNSNQPLAGVIDNIEEGSTGMTVENIRWAVRMQEWLERNARAGSRYVESIFTHFGVVSDDLRHMRPQFIGGGQQPVVVSEVLQTSETNAEVTPQGTMAGHGISIGSQNRFNGKFKEHGYVIGIMSVMPRTAYSQGLDKHWTKFSNFDYFWPEFAQLGEQEIKTSELYLDWEAASAIPGTFGYQERYGDYKETFSKIAGDFRDNLKFWHMGREFDSQPSLNSDFITADPTERIFAVDDDGATDKLYVQVLNKVKARRPVPFHNVPTL